MRGRSPRAMGEAMSVLNAASESDGTSISEIGLVSADSHVNEPRDLWASNLPPSLRSQAMEGIQSGEDGSWNVVFSGKHVYKRDMDKEAERLAVLDQGKENVQIDVDYMKTGSQNAPHRQGLGLAVAAAA